MKSLKRTLTFLLCFCLVFQPAVIEAAAGTRAGEFGWQNAFENAYKKTPSDAAAGKDQGENSLIPDGQFHGENQTGDMVWLASNSNGTKASGSNALLPVNEIKLTKVEIVNDNHGQTLPLNVGETYQLDVARYPEDATEELTFESYRPEIVEVSNTGVLTAKSTGYTSVVVRTDKYSGVSDSISVQVTNSGIVNMVFHANGGVFDNGEEDYSLRGVAKSYMNIPQPKHEGKLVEAWYTEPEFVNKVTANSYFYPELDTELYAKWSDIYTITYDYNGVKFDGDTSKEYQIIQGSAISGNYQSFPPEPDKTGGKLFVGWKDKDGKLINNIYSYIPKGDETLTAEWTDDFYTVKLDYNGITCNGRDLETRYIIKGKNLSSTPYFPSDPSETEDKVLLGWQTPAGEIIANDRIYNYVPTDNEVLYAIWSEYYTVTYDPNGGEFVSDGRKIEYVPIGEPITKVPSGNGWIKREGYLLDGWYVQETGEMADEGAFIPASDVTLMAKWSQYWTITYDANGGSYAYDSAKSAKVIRGESVYLNGASSYERSGYVLEGWCRDPECQSEVLSGYYIPQGDVTLYAKWSEYVTVTFDAGEGWVYGQHAYSEKVSKGNPIGNSYPSPSMNGAYFDGWYRDTAYQKPVNRAYVPLQDETFYAKWVQDDCWQVTLHAGGPYLSDSEGNKVSELILPVKKGYSMDYISTSRDGYMVSWYLDDSYRTPFNISNTIIDSDLALYAKWSKELKITWQADGGSDKYGKKSGILRVAQGGNYSSVFPQVSREGFALEGWFTEDGKEITSKTVFYESMTIHAKWSEGYHIQLDLQGGSIYKNGNYPTDYFLKKGEKCSYITNPIRDDAAFLGWFDENGKQIPFLSSYIPTKDMTITARWTEDFVPVHFHAEDVGVYNAYIGEYVNDMTLNAPRGENITSSEFDPYLDRDKSGKKGSWSLTEDGTQVIEIYGYTFTEETNLYATWQDAWTVCVEYMGGFNGTNSSKNTSYQVVKGTPLKYPLATSMNRPGYTFGGWYDNTDYTGNEYVIPFTPDRNMTLYARWIEGNLPKYTVSFVTNGGNELAPQEVVEGQTLALPEQPVKAGSVFAGWFTDPECRRSYDINSIVYKDITLYAGWLETTDVADAVVTVTGTYVYTGSVIIPELTVKMGTAELVKDVDYSVSGSSIDAGEAEVVITGANGYTGRRTVSFTIEPAETEAEVPMGPMYMTYGMLLKDYMLPDGWQWANGDQYLDAGTHTETIVFKAADANHKDKTAQIGLIVAPASLEPAEVTLKDSVVSYNGKEQEPEVLSVKLNENTVSSEYYEVSYEKNIEVGTGFVVITGKGNYTGSVRAEFTIEKGDPETIIGNQIYEAEYGDSLADIALPEHWTWQNPDTIVEPVTGSGNTVFPADFETYEGSSYASKEGVLIKVRVLPRKLKTTDVMLEKDQYIHDGTPHEPAVTVTVKGKELKEKTDYKVVYQGNVEIGTAKAVITGLGNYTGTVEKVFRIIADPYDIAGALIILTPAEAPYTGEAIEPDVMVRMLGTELKNGQDYTFTYKNNTEPGYGKVLVTGTGVYHGEQTAAFYIEAATYELNAVYGDKLSDVKLPIGWSWQDENLYVGDVTAKGRIFKADFSYEGMERNGAEFTVKVTPKEIGLTKIDIDRENIVYEAGKPARPEVTVTDQQLEKVLAEETDYTVTYSSNENAGEADVTVEGKGNYTGAVTDKFTIKQAEVKPEIEVPAENGVMKLTIKDEPFYLYASYAGDGNITFASDDESVFAVEKMKNDRGDENDGRITVKGIGEATLTITVEATRNYKAAELVYQVIVAPVSIAVNGITLEQTAYVYTGEPIRPAVIVKDGLATLDENRDYTVSYGENVKAGKDAGSVTITGTGDYTGTATVTFDIEKAENPMKLPVAMEGIYGQKLEELQLDGGWEWTKPDTVLDSLGSHEIGIKLPETENYREKFGVVTVTVAAKELKDVMATLEYETTEYDGTRKMPKVTMEDAGLITESDYVVDYGENVVPGTGSVTIQGQGNYTGTISKSFEIVRAALKNEYVQVTGTFVYRGAAWTPEPLVTVGERVLTRDQDYKVSYEKNTNAGTALVIVEGMGNYTGRAEAGFTIEQAEPDVKAPSGLKAVYGDLLSAVELPEHFKWVDSKAGVGNIGDRKFAAVYESPDTNYRDKELEVTVLVGRYALKAEDFKVNTEGYVYNGNEQKPEVNASAAHLKAEDYEVSYRNHVNAGKAVILIAGKENCEGTVEISFLIQKASVSINTETGDEILRNADNGSFALGAKASNGETLTYTVSDEKILTVDETGKVTPVRAGTAEITITCQENENYLGSEKKIRVTLKASESSSGGNSSDNDNGSRGGSSSGGSYTSSHLSSLPEGFQGKTQVIGNVTVPDYVIEGTWEQKEDSTWNLIGQDGLAYKNSWAPVYNPYADMSKGQSAFDWFFFDQNGNLLTGWYKDEDGNTFYLNPESDGTRGAMVTGWRLIDGKYYYFNTVSDGTRGKLLRNTTTPDGYVVDADGVWVQ